MKASGTFFLFNRVRDTGNIMLGEGSPDEILAAVDLLSRAQFLCSDFEVGWITKGSVDQAQEFDQTLRTVQDQWFVPGKRGVRLEEPWGPRNVVSVNMRDQSYVSALISQPCM